MAKAYSYIRFSRPEQMRGDSLRRQTEAAEKWAAENGMVIDESLTDFGVSAFRGLNRLKGDLGKFLDLVAQGQVPKGSFLIIESLDRFSREDALEVLTEFVKLLKAGITVVTLIDKQVYSRERIKAEPMALFGSLMVMIRSHEESSTKASRLSDSWANKRKTATEKVVTARVPGWLLVRTVDGKRRIDFKTKGREIVRRIFSDTIGGYGKRQVGQRLKDAGYETFDGGKDWHPSYIQKVLENRATFGEMQSYRRDEEGRRVPAGPPIPGYYPAAVTESDFIRAGTAKAGRNVSAGKPLSHGAVNVLRGLTYCACGSRMMRVNKGKPPKGFAYLTCADTKRGACANDRSWRLDWVEDKVLERTSRIDVGKLLAPVDDQKAAGPTPADLEARIENLTGRLAAIMDVVEQGVSEFKDRSIALAKEIKVVKAELAEMRRTGAARANEPSLEQRRALMMDLKARLASATDAERTELRTRLAQEVRGAFKRLTFGPLRIEATYKGTAPHGTVMVARDVTILVHTENPVELLDLATMELDAESLGIQDGRVAEYIRRSRLRRAAAEVAAPVGIGPDGLEVDHADPEADEGDGQAPRP